MRVELQKDFSCSEGNGPAGIIRAVCYRKAGISCLSVCQSIKRVHLRHNMLMHTYSLCKMYACAKSTYNNLYIMASLIIKLRNLT